MAKHKIAQRRSPDKLSRRAPSITPFRDQLIEMAQLLLKGDYNGKRYRRYHAVRRAVEPSYKSSSPSPMSFRIITKRPLVTIAPEIIADFKLSKSSISSWEFLLDWGPNLVGTARIHWVNRRWMLSTLSLQRSDASSQRNFMRRADQMRDASSFVYTLPILRFTALVGHREGNPFLIPLNKGFTRLRVGTLYRLETAVDRLMKDHDSHINRFQMNLCPKDNT